MEQSTLEKETISTTKQNLENFAKTHDAKYVAEDAVFKNMGTGEETKGREAIAGLLQYLYHIAFDARAEVINMVITEDKAVLEGSFKGKHIGEFAGLAATNKEVDVPLCVSYDIENGLIKYARIYMLSDVLMQHLNK